MSLLRLARTVLTPRRCVIGVRRSSGHQQESIFHQTANKHTLVLVRHGESIWNKENRFTGWCDVPLSEKGHGEAIDAGKLLAKEHLVFDVAYSSYLKRAIQTLGHVLEETDLLWIPVNRSWRLNERHYGALTGLNKQETIAKHGKDKVMLWRRSYDVPPPALDEASEHWPGHDRRYKTLAAHEIPKTESLKTTVDRFLPFWESDILPDLKESKKVLVVAHGNSLRALVMHLDNIPESVITSLDIPTGVPIVYNLDENMKPINHPDALEPMSGRFLGDVSEIKARIQGVKNQTK